MKSRAAKLFFAIGSFALAIGLFAYGVLATIRIGANLSGSFTFNVPNEMFHLDIQAIMSGHQGEDEPWGHNFHQENKVPVNWNINNNSGKDYKAIHFKEGAGGLVEDIVFSFIVINKNESQPGGIQKQVRVTYELVNSSQGVIELIPSENLKNGIVLEPLLPLVPGVGEQEQDDNRAEFTVTLSTTQEYKKPSTNFEAEFNFRINFEFVS